MSFRAAFCPRSAVSAAPPRTALPLSAAPPARGTCPRLPGGGGGDGPGCPLLLLLLLSSFSFSSSSSPRRSRPYPARCSPRTPRCSSGASTSRRGAGRPLPAARSRGRRSPAGRPSRARNAQARGSSARYAASAIRETACARRSRGAVAVALPRLKMAAGGAALTRDGCALFLLPRQSGRAKPTLPGGGGARCAPGASSRITPQRRPPQSGE